MCLTKVLKKFNCFVWLLVVHEDTPHATGNWQIKSKPMSLQQMWLVMLAADVSLSLFLLLNILI